MNAEITDGNAQKPTAWVFYDGECAFCLGWVRRLHRLVSSRGFKFETLQKRYDRTHLAGSSGSLPRPAFAEMILELPDGREFGGAAAAMEIARHIWWLWPLWLLSRIPGAMMAFRAGYRQIARHRHCLGGGGDLDAPSLKPHRHGAFFEMP